MKCGLFALANISHKSSQKSSASIDLEHILRAVFVLYGSSKSTTIKHIISVNMSAVVQKSKKNDVCICFKQYCNIQTYYMLSI